MLQFLWKTDGGTILKGIGLIILTGIVMGFTVMAGNINLPSLVGAFVEFGVALATGIKFIYKPARKKMQKE